MLNGSYKNGAFSDGRVMGGESVHLEAEPRVWGWAWPASVSAGGRGQPCAPGARCASPGMFAPGLLRNLSRLNSPPSGTLGVCLLAVHILQIFPKDKAET